jgi:tetratricopeptide (TPR) repeat protein
MGKTAWWVAGLLVAAPVASAEPDAAAPAPGAVPAEVTAWLEGDATRAARELSNRADRGTVLNHAVAILYAGDAPGAESELQALRAREPGFTPALRWLARARAEAGSPALDETIEALLADRSADARDFLWAGRLRLDGGQVDLAAASLSAAVKREPELYLGWLWLGDAEEQRGGLAAARQAWLHARLLHAGGDVLIRLGRSSLHAGRVEEARVFLAEALCTPEGRRQEDALRRLLPGLPPPPPAPSFAPVTRPGERLRYTARYLFFRFGILEIENQGWTEARGRPAMRLVLTVRSNPGFPFLKIDSRFETLIGEDGSVLAHRSLSRDSTQVDHASVYDMDPENDECVVRRVVDGLFAFDRLPLPVFAQDGVSVLQLARALARAPAGASVLTAVDGTWKGTVLRTGGTSRRGWKGREIETVEVESEGQYRGPAGQSGRVRAWISRDDRAVPYRAAIKVGLGSVVLTLREDSEGIEP